MYILSFFHHPFILLPAAGYSMKTFQCHGITMEGLDAVLQTYMM